MQEIQIPGIYGWINLSTSLSKLFNLCLFQWNKYGKRFCYTISSLLKHTSLPPSLSPPQVPTRVSMLKAFWMSQAGQDSNQSGTQPLMLSPWHFPHSTWHKVSYHRLVESVSQDSGERWGGISIWSLGGHSGGMSGGRGSEGRERREEEGWKWERRVPFPWHNPRSPWHRVSYHRLVVGLFMVEFDFDMWHSCVEIRESDYWEY